MLLSVANARPRNIETSKASSLFPETVQENAGLLISFIEKYYEYMNLVGLPSGELSRITSDKDIDLVSNKYLTQIQSLIARNVPESNVLDKVSLYKIILQYYRTRGTEDSVYAFFKLFFNELITIFYPRDYLFELSQGSGEWRDINFSTLRTSKGNPNKSRMVITSDIEVGPRGIGLDPKRVELVYIDKTTWAYYDTGINTQFPYLTREAVDINVFRWKFAYGALTVYSDDDSEWPDEATWSAFERDVYYHDSNGAIRKLQYDSGSQWRLLGDHISGEEINSSLGNSVSLNASGTRLAIGSSYFGTVNDDTGHSRVYELNEVDASWTQIGQDLTSGFANNNISYSLLLNSQGNRVAVTAADPLSTTVGSDYGKTRVYEYISGADRWKQIGQTIEPIDLTSESIFATEKLDNEFIVQQTNNLASNYESPLVTEGVSSSLNPADFYGTRIAYSGDGSTLAVSYLFKYSTTAIYKYNTKDRRWQQIGSPILGQQSNDYSGYSISLNENGSVLAIGTPRYDFAGDVDNGKVEVYRYSSSAKNWLQYGNVLLPDGDPQDEYGFSVSLNSSGNSIAIGTIRGKNPQEVSTGYTQIFNYDLNSDSWQQIGQTIYGENDGDYGGYSVALNSSGNICAIGYRKYDSYYYGYETPTGTLDSGIVKVYEYNAGSWSQISNSIEGEFSYDYIGSALSISDDGLTVAVGATGWENETTGAVHVYTLDVIKDFKFANKIDVEALSEFAYSYGEIINSLENFPQNTVYDSVGLNPTIWQRADITRQWANYDRKSFASDSYKLHDGYYWQKYSYDIKTSKPVAEWLDDYLKFVHPAGLQLFASVLLQLLSTRDWNTAINYSAPQPQIDFSWIAAQRAPMIGAHTPFYQPGWLSVRERIVSVFARALRLNESDRNLYNLVYHIIKTYYKNSNFRDKRAREDYQNWLKFFDAGELISGYTDKTIAQANEEYAFDNACKFSNVSSIIKIVSDGRYLENNVPRDLETGVMRLTEANEAFTELYTLLLENEDVLELESGENMYQENTEVIGDAIAWQWLAEDEEPMVFESGNNHLLEI